MKSKVTLESNEQVLLEISPNLSYRYQLCWMTLKGILFYVLIMGVTLILDHLIGKGANYQMAVGAVHGAKTWFIQSDTQTLVIFVSVILAICAVIFLCFTTRIKQFKYMITNKRCIIQAGIWSKYMQILPLGVYYDFKICQSLMESRLDLYSLQLIQVQALPANSRRRKMLKNRSLVGGLSKQQVDKIIELVTQLATAGSSKGIDGVANVVL